MVWKKGQSGNPKGRKKRRDSITERLRYWMEVPFDDFQKAKKHIKDKKTKKYRYIDIYVITRLNRCLSSEYAAKNVNDRLEGKSPLSLQNPDGSNLLDGLTPDHAVEIAEAFMVAHKAKK